MFQLRLPETREPPGNNCPIKLFAYSVFKMVISQGPMLIEEAGCYPVE
jgi:hypothetical protein